MLGERWVLPKHTPMLTPSGRQVAVLRVDVDVTKPAGSSVGIDRDLELEFPFLPGPRTARAPRRSQLHLCAPVSSVKHIPAPG